MKRLSMVLAATMLFLCGCSSILKCEWQTIAMNNCGTMKIPANWTYFVEDGVMYILNDKNEPAMISYDVSKESNSNRYIKDFQLIEWISNEVLSNEPMLGRAKYRHGDDEIVRYFLNLTTNSDDDVEFIVWDEEITKEMLVAIAKTFINIEIFTEVDSLYTENVIT